MEGVKLKAQGVSRSLIDYARKFMWVREGRRCLQRDLAKSKANCERLRLENDELKEEREGQSVEITRLQQELQTSRRDNKTLTKKNLQINILKNEKALLDDACKEHRAEAIEYRRDWEHIYEALERTLGVETNINQPTPEELKRFLKCHADQQARHELQQFHEWEDEMEREQEEFDIGFEERRRQSMELEAQQQQQQQQQTPPPQQQQPQNPQ